MNSQAISPIYYHLWLISLVNHGSTAYEVPHNFCLSKISTNESPQVNIDWAGILLERATNQSLDQYFKEHIFKPLGITDISLFPDESMKSRLAFMHNRATDGSLSRRDHLLHRPLIAKSAEDIKACLNSGGAGGFAKPTEYCSTFCSIFYFSFSFLRMNLKRTS
jgi:hypothetical protein